MSVIPQEEKEKELKGKIKTTLKNKNSKSSKITILKNESDKIMAFHLHTY